MCNINIKQDRNNASSSFGVNQQHFHASAGENAVLSQTAQEKENWLLNSV